MAYKLYYFNNYNYNSNWSNPANACDDDTVDYASVTNATGNIIYSSNSCPGTNYGTITAVYVAPYRYQNWAAADALIINAIWGGTDSHFVGNIAAPPSGPSESSINIFAATHAPSPWAWSDVAALDLRVFTVTPVSKVSYLYRTRISVVYTPVASTGTITTPGDGLTVYRTGTGVSLSVIADNPNGVYSVEYNIDGGAWVALNGLWGVWYGIIPHAALAVGARVINTRVRDDSTDRAYTTTDHHHIIMSPLPAQSV